MAQVNSLNILAGDRILIDGWLEGTVAFSSISDSYSIEYRKDDHSGNENDGILIVQDNGARIFHERKILEGDDCSVEILKRKKATSHKPLDL